MHCEEMPVRNRAPIRKLFVEFFDFEKLYSLFNIFVRKYYKEFLIVQNNISNICYAK